MSGLWWSALGLASAHALIASVIVGFVVDSAADKDSKITPAEARAELLAACFWPLVLAWWGADALARRVWRGTVRVRDGVLWLVSDLRRPAPQTGPKAGYRTVK